MAQKNEPSMEEILSSIKRIIAEEGEGSPAPARRAPEPEPEPEPDFEPDVLELDQAVFEPAAMPAPEPEREPEEVSAEEAPAIAEAPVAPPQPARLSEPKAEQPDTLLSRTSAEATRQALASLSKMVVRPEDPAADNTLESLIRELLRPMLKDWLDANLPRIVQATVDREVARISGRG
jgi:uncharacterized protein